MSKHYDDMETIQCSQVFIYRYKVLTHYERF